MTKEKAYYQAYLILEKLPKEEYELIPEKILDEIKSKMEYEAIKSYEQAIKIEPFALTVNIKLGNLYKRKKIFYKPR